jgi:hypothetical protein
MGRLRLRWFTKFPETQGSHWVKNRTLDHCDRVISMMRTIHFVGALCMAGCASSPPPATIIPADVPVIAGEQFAFAWAATGTQSFECVAKKAKPDEFEWDYVAPAAQLRDAQARPTGTYGTGPTWTAQDGSALIGKIRERRTTESGPPVLIFDVKAKEAAGVLAAVSSVARMHMQGGAAPSAGCKQSELGQRASAPYTASYYFYTKR